jgi:hypothetical protein
VTGDACRVCESITMRTGSFVHLMAIRTGDGGMSARQREPGFTVPHQREGGRCESIDRMTRLTKVREFCCELSCMRVLVAWHARLGFRVIVRSHAFGLVALPARYGQVFSRERVARGRVKFHIERGGLEAVYRMARPAFDSRGPLRELTAVLVRMAIDTSGVPDRRAETRSLVTVAAEDGRVLAGQRVTCAAVIEIGERRRSRDAPSGCLVALLARRRKTAVVRVAMAARTLAERNALETYRCAFSLGRVTSLAGHLLMQAGKRKPRLHVIEVRNGLPRSRRMAAYALRAQLSGVLVFVAGQAGRLQPEIALRRVTLIAGERRMPSFKRIARLRVVELRDTAGPTDEIEIATGMLGVTPNAVALTFS